MDEEEAGLFTCSQSRRRRRQQRQHHWIRQSQHLPHISILSTQLPSGSKPTTIKNTDKHVPHSHTPPTPPVPSLPVRWRQRRRGGGVENKTPGSRRIPAFPHPRADSPLPHPNALTPALPALHNPAATPRPSRAPSPRRRPAGRVRGGSESGAERARPEAPGQGGPDPDRTARPGTPSPAPAHRRPGFPRKVRGAVRPRRASPASAPASLTPAPGDPAPRPRPRRGDKPDAPTSFTHHHPRPRGAPGGVQARRGEGESWGGGGGGCYLQRRRRRPRSCSGGGGGCSRGAGGGEGATRGSPSLLLPSCPPPTPQSLWPPWSPVWPAGGQAAGCRGGRELENKVGEGNVEMETEIGVVQP